MASDLNLGLTILDPSTDAPIPPKFCKDCAHILVGASRDYERAKCGATRKLRFTNLVSGEPVYEERLCSHERDDGNSRCGPNGKLFILYQRAGLTSDRRPLEPFNEKEVITRTRRNPLDLGM